MSTRRSSNKANNNVSAPILGQKSSHIPVISGAHRSPYGYFNENVSRTNREAQSTNLLQAILQYNDPEKVQDCLDNGADVNIQDESGRTPLMCCVNHHREIISILLKEGADVTLQDNEGKTALFYAVKCKDFYFAQRLVEINHGLINKTNPQGRTILMLLVLEGYLTDEDEMVRWLLNHGADANIKDKDGHTALTLSFVEKYIRRRDKTLSYLIKILLEEGQADPNYLNPVFSATALELKLTGQVLVDHGADPTLKNSRGVSAVSYVEKNVTPMLAEELYPYLQPWLKSCVVSSEQHK